MTTSRSRFRGRRVILWSFVAFAAAQIVAGLILDNVCPLVRFEEARWNLRRYRGLCEAGRTPHVLVLGSSRFELAINEEAMTGSLRRAARDSSLRTFNASVLAGDVETCDFLMDRCFENAAKPRLVLIEVSPESLHPSSRWINYQVLRTLRWQDLPKSAVQVCQSGNPVTLMRARFLPLITYRKHIANATAEAVDEWKNGPRPACPDSCPETVDWHAKIAIPNAGASEVAARARGNQPFFERALRDYRIGGTAQAALERMLGRCRSEGIHVVLLQAPVTTHHHELYSPETNAVYREYLKRLETTRGVEFVDCSARLPDTLFVDGHHANESGGICFGEILGREILAPRLQTGAIVGQTVSRKTP